MTPTLQDGQWLLLDTQDYKLTGGPERGDIVVLRHNGERWIKRLVGLPGDRIQIEYREYGLIKQITNLTTNPDAELKRRANVETRFSAPVMAAGYERVYRKLVEPDASEVAQ